MLVAQNDALVQAATPNPNPNPKPITLTPTPTLILTLTLTPTPTPTLILTLTLTQAGLLETAEQSFAVLGAPVFVGAILYLLKSGGG